MKGDYFAYILSYSVNFLGLELHRRRTRKVEIIGFYSAENFRMLCFLSFFFLILYIEKTKKKTHLSTRNENYFI